MTQQTAETPAPNPRSCGDCSECCFTLKINELVKPERTWCQFAGAAQGKGCSGCTIYESRPPVCHDFKCRWLEDASFGTEEDRPDKIGAIFRTADVGDMFVTDCITRGDELTPRAMALVQAVRAAEDICMVTQPPVNGEPKVSMATSAKGFGRMMALHRAAREKLENHGVRTHEDRDALMITIQSQRGS